MSLAWRQVVHYPIFAAKWTVGTSISIPMKDFRNCILAIWTTSNANMTVKAQWAIATYTNPDTPPDFTASQSSSNLWDYVQMIDLNSWATVAWDTWFVVTGTDDVKLYEINTNSLAFLAFTITAVSAWNVTAELILTTNL